MLPPLLVPGMRRFVMLALVILCVNAAVIEVTAGGETHAPTYKFSNSVGTESATLTGNVANGDITASADLKSTLAGSENSLNDVATRLELAEAAISTLQTALTICCPSSPLSPPSAPPIQYVNFTGGETANSPQPGLLVSTGWSGHAWGHIVYASKAITSASDEKGIAFTISTCYGSTGCVPYAFLGLATGTSTPDYLGIDFAFFFWDEVNMAIREEGSEVYTQSGIDWSQGPSVFEVRITTGSGVQFVRDGTVLWTASRAITWPMHVTADFAETGAVLDNIRYLTAAEQAGW